MRPVSLSFSFSLLLLAISLACENVFATTDRTAYNKRSDVAAPYMAESNHVNTDSAISTS